MLFVKIPCALALLPLLLHSVAFFAFGGFLQRL